jgi:hypothetical protein
MRAQLQHPSGNRILWRSPFDDAARQELTLKVTKDDGTTGTVNFIEGARCN